MDNSLQDSIQPISDDQELAKALAGITDEPEQPAATDLGALPQMPGAPDLGQFSAESDPPVGMPQPNPSPVIPDLTPAPADSTPSLPPLPTQPVEHQGRPEDQQPSHAGNLDNIKKDALNELRPLVDRVNLAPEEKFDIYLMLIRSTDDTSLIEPAHAAAQNIEDEKKKAEALLDIIKEIDYLSRKDQKQQ